MAPMLAPMRRLLTRSVGPRAAMAVVLAGTLGVTVLAVAGPGTGAMPDPADGAAVDEPAPVAPTITYVVDRPPDEADDDLPPWYRAPVTFRFTCADADSVVAICPIPATFTEDGRGLVTAVAALDAEGHSTITITPPINLDQTPPDVMLVGVADGAVLPAHPTVTCEASDALSGVLRACAVGGAAPLGGGWYSVTVEAHDRAGNVARSTARYQLEPAPPDGLVAVVQSTGSAPITEVFLGFDVSPPPTASANSTGRSPRPPVRPGPTISGRSSSPGWVRSEGPPRWPRTSSPARRRSIRWSPAPCWWPTSWPRTGPGSAANSRRRPPDRSRSARSSRSAARSATSVR